MRTHNGRISESGAAGAVIVDVVRACGVQEEKSGANAPGREG